MRRGAAHRGLINLQSLRTGLEIGMLKLFHASNVHPSSYCSSLVHLAGLVNKKLSPILRTSRRLCIM